MKFLAWRVGELGERYCFVVVESTDVESRQASCSSEGDSKGRVTFRLEKSARRSYRVNFIG